MSFCQAYSPSLSCSDEWTILSTAWIIFYPHTVLDTVDDFVSGYPLDKDLFGTVADLKEW